MRTAAVRGDNAMERLILNNGWKLRQAEPAERLEALDTKGLTASSWLEIGDMPSMVHTILEKKGIIKTPWLPGQAKECLWVAEKDWVYSNDFNVENIPIAAALCFGGLDTIVDIWLNGNKIASHSSMYVPLRLDISGLLKNKNNWTLHFKSVFDLSSGKAVPVTCVDSDPFKPVRRSKCNYTDYLGPHPYFSKVGVFGEIALEMGDGSRLDPVVANVFLSDDFRMGRIDTSISGFTRGTGFSCNSTIINPAGKVVASHQQPLESGVIAYRISPEITDPELWWPRGYGSQPLYKLATTLVDPSGAIVQTETRTIGFRKVTMPKPLHFTVNGKPVRLWGGNWVCPNWDTAVWDHDRAAVFFDTAEEANFNVMRVWGEPESPADDFYEMADARGFMIWQDFTDLPFKADDTSVGVCKNEALHLIMRLKHHACIFLWNGGNEESLWNEAQFGGPGGEWPGKHAAEHSVAFACAELDPQRPYIPNSPYYGIDSNDPKNWNTHGYTNIWYIPGYDYLNFATEDTRIAPPDVKSLKRFFDPEHLWPKGYSSVWKPGTRYPWPVSWNNYTGALAEKKTGPVEEFYDAESPEELVYRLGMAEAKYYRETIERQRRGRAADDPSSERFCGGYLVWKLNDSWPQMYSSKVDFFQEPLIPYYPIKRSFAPVLVSIEVGVYINVWVVNDTPEAVAGEVEVILFHIEKNAVAKTLRVPCRVEPDKSESLVRLDQAGIGSFFREHVILARLIAPDGTEIARNVALMDIERRLAFP